MMPTPKFDQFAIFDLALGVIGVVHTGVFK